ncbi:hypothetical protein B9Z55_021662 [Caenorhabditis nigoni]|uniref:SPK domain-containing protein n=1 Tax=Caenorhabditis nigoni TaxID=1611254 RepID=A0A2G5TSY3_9PELO|nr:hypothetical protein B9Z55_021662 [Caenorhabditis nigoni]
MTVDNTHFKKFVIQKAQESKEKILHVKICEIYKENHGTSSVRAVNDRFKRIMAKLDTWEEPLLVKIQVIFVYNLEVSEAIERQIKQHPTYRYSMVNGKLASFCSGDGQLTLGSFRETQRQKRARLSNVAQEEELPELPEPKRRDTRGARSREEAPDNASGAVGPRSHDQEGVRGQRRGSRDVRVGSRARVAPENEPAGPEEVVRAPEGPPANREPEDAPENDQEALPKDQVAGPDNAPRDAPEDPNALVAPENAPDGPRHRQNGSLVADGQMMVAGEIVVKTEAPETDDRNPEEPGPSTSGGAQRRQNQPPRLNGEASESETMDTKPYVQRPIKQEPAIEEEPDDCMIVNTVAKTMEVRKFAKGLEVFSQAYNMHQLKEQANILANEIPTAKKMEIQDFEEQMEYMLSKFEEAKSTTCPDGKLLSMVLRELEFIFLGQVGLDFVKKTSEKIEEMRRKAEEEQSKIPDIVIKERLESLLRLCAAHGHVDVPRL